MSAVQAPVTLPPGAEAALRSLFGEAQVERLAPLPGGASGAPIFSFAVGGAEYVLRKTDAGRAPREHTCLRIASEQGVAPRLRYADPATGISIMDRIAGVPAAGAVLADPAGLQRMATTLRRLHDGPAFPRGTPVPEIARAMDARIQGASGEALPGEVHDALGEVASCTARYAESAPCHNDLNPSNILATKDRFFVVDWHTACAGDPFFDLGQLGVFALPAPEQRSALLAAYLGHPPTGEERARATVGRVAALALYAAGFFYHRAVLSGRPPARCAPIPLPELFRALGTAREGLDPGVVAASLFREMQRERATREYASARATLAAA